MRDRGGVADRRYANACLIDRTDSRFAAAARTGTAFEINGQPDRQDLTDVTARKAKEAGVKILLSTDAHAPGQLDWLAYGTSRAQQVGIPPERIVNTWPLDDLLAWSRPDA